MSIEMRDRIAITGNKKKKWRKESEKYDVDRAAMTCSRG